MLILLCIVVGAVIALLIPDSVLWMEPALQPAFAVTMFFVGTLVKPLEVREFAAAPLRPIAGLAAQYTIMPVCAGALSLAFDDPLLRTGIVLVGCMPGAMASNVMTVLLRGDLILSVTMTTLASLCCPLVIAFWLPLLADARLDVQVAPLVWNATWMVVLPVAFGVILRWWRESVPRNLTQDFVLGRLLDVLPRYRRAEPAFADVARLLSRAPRHWDAAATAIASGAIVLIILVVVAKNRARLTALGPELLLGMIGLNLAGYALAFAVATGMRWPAPQRRTLMVEVSMQNAGLGCVLALTHLGAAGAVPSAFYTVLCVLTACLALPFSRRF